MFVIQSYALAVIFCIVTMLCWGSWANTQKLAGARWRFELFYWDYVIGVLLMSLVFAFTLGSMGVLGRSFLTDLKQADPINLGWAALGGVIFNVANLMLVAAIAIAGMSVAFPVGIGLALIVGVIVNYVNKPEGNPIVLALGVAFVTVAIIIDALAYRRLPGQVQASKKGLVLSLICGVLMGTFYVCVAHSMADLKGEHQFAAGKLTPYTALVFFSLGILASHIFGYLFMFANTAQTIADPVPLGEYAKGSAQDHLWGIIGGAIWCVGMTFSIIASGEAGFPISYGLGQGATLVAAIWGVFIWREFRTAPKGTGWLLAIMFVCFGVGLSLLIGAKVPAVLQLMGMQ